MTTRCEDYPCCGHTDGLPCNWTAPDYSNDPHLMCDHAAGVCDVWEDEDECDPANGFCAYDSDDCGECRDYWLDFHAEAMMEDRWLDGSYEE